MSSIKASSKGNASKGKVDEEGSLETEELFNKEFLDTLNPNDIMSSFLAKSMNILQSLKDSLSAYGPPYISFHEAETEYINLFSECSKAEISVIKVHLLLHGGLNPNQPDYNDLNFTPIHYCCRFGHLLILRLFKRAGANFNISNEFGITPLSFCVMQRQPPELKATQQSMAEFLIAEGAFVNARDKGGYSALDYAAMNSDMDLVLLLLHNGATVSRENRTLIAPRRNILQFAKDPEVYRVLFEKLQIENEIFKASVELKEANLKAEADERYRLKAREMDKIRRLERQKREEEEFHIKNQAEFKKCRLKIIDDELAKEVERNALRLLDKGVWVKEASSKWRFDRHCRAPSEKVTAYTNGKKMLQDLSDSNSYDKFNKKWNSLTSKEQIESESESERESEGDREADREGGRKGGGVLEIAWTRNKKFQLDSDSDNEKEKEKEIEKEKEKEKGGIGNVSINSPTGVNDLYDTISAEELKGVDLNDIFDSLSGI